MANDLAKVTRSMRKRQETSVVQPFSLYPFLDFRYTCVEIDSIGEQTRLRASETRLENGRLVSEECEGTLAHDAYRQALMEVQRQFADQIAVWMKSLSWFLPFPTIPRDDDR
jgi:hypothetical protein